jgi:hypothetical protein
MQQMVGRFLPDNQYATLPGKVVQHQAKQSRIRPRPSPGILLVGCRLQPHFLKLGGRDNVLQQLLEVGVSLQGTVAVPLLPEAAHKMCLGRYRHLGMRIQHTLEQRGARAGAAYEKDRPMDGEVRDRMHTLRHQ